MKNSNEKLRDMVRSILPSRYRTGPRAEKLQRKRSHRRDLRIDLAVEDPESTAADFLRDVYVEDIVFWRRAGDKLGGFLRWCHAITRGMSERDALGYVRGIVPRGVIGDHAYAHWELERSTKHRFGRFARTIWKSPAQRRQSYIDSTTVHLTRALDLDPSLHGRLNAIIKARKPFDQPRRLLRGVHDVAAFVRDTAPRDHLCTTDPHIPEREAIRIALDERNEGRPQGRPSRFCSRRVRRGAVS